MFRFFARPAAVAIVLGAIVLILGGPEAFIAVALLSMLETALSFDNAVVNAAVLKRMSPSWQRRFLTWGILVAVVGTRLVLPVLVIAAAAWRSPLSVVTLAFSGSAAYGALIENARFSIAAFGGSFLSMLSLRYFFDREKTVHWIIAVERRLTRLGTFESAETFVTLCFLMAATWLSAPDVRIPVVVAGVVGVALSIAMERVTRTFSAGVAVAAAGFSLFLYLEVLDTAFSLDGVVGAFALTTSIPLIVIGLGVGAYFVRSLTLYLAEHRVLDSLRFVEHGAYWAIVGLSLSMFAGIVVPVPEYLTGSIGFLCMTAAYVSSVRVRGMVQ